MSDVKTTNNRAPKGENINKGRRKIATAGLAAAPLLLMVKSRAVLAVNNSCTVSGLDSGNISTGREGSDPCSLQEYYGRTPGYWGTHPDKWPHYGCDAGTCANAKKGTCHSYKSDGTKFQDVFFGNTNVLLLDKSMMQVVQLIGDPAVGDQYQLGAHSVCAYLNAKAYPGNFPYTPDEVVALYNQYHTNPADAEMLKNVFRQLNEMNNGPDPI